MASPTPKAIIQLSAVDPAVKLAFMKEAVGFKSPSDLFEKMWQAWVAAQSSNA